jgi:hydroxyacylglutathione hydrolase
MLEIKNFTVNPLFENCYVVSDDTKECVIIDCGAYNEKERQAIKDYINDNNLRPKHLIQTHGHIDHCIGNGFIAKEYGLYPEVHVNDQPLMEKLPMQSEIIFGKPLVNNLPHVGKYFTDKDIIQFGNHTFSIIETPGHSPGGVFFYCKEENVSFSGDTLFKGSIGRTDFMGGSMFQIIQSLRTICQLDDDIKVYPGHGESSTIGYECATNMYIDR